MVIINKGNVPNKQPFPLGNTTVELVTKYMLIQKGNVLNPFGGTELSIPRSSLPGDHRYDDADQVVATTTTDPSGNFSFSFLQTDSTGLLETNQTINLLPGDLSNYQTGDLYKVYRVIVESPYYLSPDQDVIIQPYENKDVGSLSALVKTYSLKITVMPTSYKASSQATQVPLGGTYVYILRQSRPLGVPGTEGYPSPPSSQTMAGMEVVAEGQADENGEANGSTAPRCLFDIGVCRTETRPDDSRRLRQPVCLQSLAFGHQCLASLAKRSQNRDAHRLKIPAKPVTEAGVT